MTRPIKQLLFLSEKNSCRGQMAEGFARAFAPYDVQITSAGISSGKVHPLAIKVMSEAGIDISMSCSKAISDLKLQLFDVVVTLCPYANKHCPTLPGIPAKVYWNLPDPLTAGNDEKEILEAIRQSRDKIKHLVQGLFEYGYFQALATQKNNVDSILENLSEGIVAHDLQRKIFYFNGGAEKITGYRREEVLGKDCHDIFPGGFCGGKCSFQDKGICRPKQLDYSLDIITKDGEKRFLKMLVSAMKNNEGKITGILASYRDQTRILELERRLGEVQQFSGIIGRDHKMLQIYELIRDLAASNAPVLIEGETGTGKELVAAAIHNESLRAGKLFVPVNCGALPEGTLESELFGHVKGAFTGAIRDKKGRFELADGGTIFLDEVGELSPTTQVKLLRVLQEGTFERVGGEETIKVNVRVISATNRDLKEMVTKGKFREDLFYRLCVVPITLPPLRERRNDILLLAKHFLKRLSQEAGRDGLSFSNEALAALMNFNWPGNVRQLQNSIQFALVRCRGKVIEPLHLPPEITIQLTQSKLRPGPKSKLDYKQVHSVLKKAGGNKTKAAKILGVGRATLYRFLSEKTLF